MAARSPPGVSRAARSSTLSSAARASASSSRAVARAMISALYRVMMPSSSAAAVPGSRVCRVWARSTRSPARPRDSASALASSSAGEFFVLGGAGVTAGQLGDGGELAGARRGPRPGPTRTPPRPAQPRTPRRNRRPRPRRRRLPPGPRSRAARPAASPAPNAAAGLDDSPGKIRAEPGWPGPRRPVVAASTASSSSAAASRISASSSAVNGLDVLVLVRAGRLIVLADPVQARLQLGRRHRIRTRPGRIIVPLWLCGNRFRRHVPPPVRNDDLYRT